MLLRKTYDSPRSPTHLSWLRALPSTCHAPLQPPHMYVKGKGAAGVGRVGGRKDDGPQHIHALLVDAHAHAALPAQRQLPRQRGHFPSDVPQP